MTRFAIIYSTTLLFFLISGVPGLSQLHPSLLESYRHGWISRLVFSRELRRCDGSFLYFIATVHGRVLANGIWQALGKCSHKMSWLDQTNMFLPRQTRISSSVCLLSKLLLKAIGKCLPSPWTIQKLGETPMRPIFQGRELRVRH